MRVLIGVLIALGVLALPASAAGRRGATERPRSETKPRIDEKAYKAALDRIPVPKEKYDPWGQMRPAASAPK